MVRTTKQRHIIQAPSGTDLSTIMPKLPKRSTLKPLKHRVLFGRKILRYFVPNDGCDYFLFQRNRSKGIRACTLQERLENEDLVVRDVLDFGEKEISCQKEFEGQDREIAALSEELKKELKEKDQKISVLTRRVFDFEEEEEIFHKREKKLKQELQEKDKEIAVLTEQIKGKSQENDTLQKILLQSLEKQIRKARKEHLKRFQKERFAQDIDNRFY